MWTCLSDWTHTSLYWLAYMSRVHPPLLPATGQLNSDAMSVSCVSATFLSKLAGSSSCQGCFTLAVDEEFSGKYFGPIYLHGLYPLPSPTFGSSDVGCCYYWANFFLPSRSRRWSSVHLLRSLLKTEVF